MKTDDIGQYPTAAVKTDAELAVRSRKGDGRAFRLLVEHNMRLAYSAAFRFLTDEQDAKDIVQEAFVRVWNHLDEFDERRKFSTWLYKIVVNLCLDRLRGEKRRRRLFEPLDDETDAAAEENMAEGFDQRELAGRIRAAAGALPEKQRAVFILRDLEDLSIEETAGVLGISTSSVKANLCYARQTLRAMLEAEEKRQ